MSDKKKNKKKDTHNTSYIISLRKTLLIFQRVKPRTKFTQTKTEVLRGLRLSKSE